MRYEGSVFRPPSEARSYILQCTVGCTHNRCTFCSMYKDKKYHVRSMEEILADIEMAKQYYGDLYKVFLADGDALAMKTEELVQILSALYRVSRALNTSAYMPAPTAYSLKK